MVKVIAYLNIAERAVQIKSFTSRVTLINTHSQNTRLSFVTRAQSHCPESPRVALRSSDKRQMVLGVDLVAATIHRYPYSKSR